MQGGEQRSPAHDKPIAAVEPARGKDPRRVEDLMQYGLLLSAWIMAFMLGKELQVGFAQWRARRHSQD
jgi:hypothetical protein